jgi:hypothetical protein
LFASEPARAILTVFDESFVSTTLGHTAGRTSSDQIWRRTSICCVQLAELPHRSVAVHWRRMTWWTRSAGQPVGGASESTKVIVVAEDCGHVVVAVAKPMSSGAVDWPQVYFARSGQWISMPPVVVPPGPGGTGVAAKRQPSAVR